MSKTSVLVSLLLCSSAFAGQSKQCSAFKKDVLEKAVPEECAEGNPSVAWNLPKDGSEFPRVLFYEYKNGSSYIKIQYEH